MAVGCVAATKAREQENVVVERWEAVDEAEKSADSMHAACLGVHDDPKKNPTAGEKVLCVPADCRPPSIHRSEERAMSDRRQLLIVEDNEESVIFLSRILEDQGYQCQVARNGMEAISALRQSQPELVLLDIMMPGKSGIHVFREMKANSDLENIPVIVVTGMSQVTGIDLHTGKEEPKQDEGDVAAHRFGSMLREKTRGLTPDGLIEKPIDPVVLIERIQGLLS
jgi:CheY-like chemotaxis protein